ncbi:hypothetical protein QQF64_023597 [Cirrhinus molitorella]|uniref:CCHC-type domain-containing protein n=1 Tax=Cirrhinus molitorella TaxID=172907 RepID=A0ABR3NJ41_9TELE
MTLSMDTEQLQDLLSKALLRLRLDQLQEVCVYAKLSAEGQSKRHSLIRLISEAVDNVRETEEDDVARQHVKDLLEFDRGMTRRSDPAIQNGGGDTDRSEAELAYLKRQYAELQPHFKLSTSMLKNEIQRLSLKVPFVSSPPVFPQHQQAVPEVTIPCDFKINGQIGEWGQKDKLSYNNLIHQIDAGINKGHRESEIIDAVIRAISPGMSLLDMLEIKTDLTLSQLCTILKGHYKEESSTDLYHRLINVTQENRHGQERLKQLKEEIGEIRKVMTTYRCTQHRERKRGCRVCQEQGRGDQCDHCFKCGHLSRGCRGPPAGRTERGHSTSSMTVTAHTTSPQWSKNETVLLCDSIKQLEARETMKQKETYRQLIRSVSANQLSTKHNAVAESDWREMSGELFLRWRGSSKKQQKVKQLLREESGAFAHDDSDVGCIPSLQLKIHLHDTTPVKHTYMSVPKPLHKEVKEYLEDLLNKGWVSRSKSSYSSPVVCVCKKDGTLRLCCDYRLNKKSIPDRHPIPRIQAMLDSLVGSAWFSVLDQGKA